MIINGLPDSAGERSWTNEAGAYHRLDGPAIIYPYGVSEY
jgi:hypothetical protein